jgi:hypothetical protein
MYSKGSSCLSEEGKTLGYVYIPYVKCVSEKFKRIWNLYNIRRIFISKHPVNVTEAGLAKQANRPLAVRFHEHRLNFKERLLEESKLAQHP